jgi:hypothetical protein
VDIAVRICFVKDMWESCEGEDDNDVNGVGSGNGSEEECFLERKVLCDGGEDVFISNDSKRLSLSIIGDKIIISNNLI